MQIFCRTQLVTDPRSFWLRLGRAALCRRVAHSGALGNPMCATLYRRSLTSVQHSDCADELIQTKSPCRFSREGLLCVQMDLELVDQVQCQGDGVALEMRPAAIGIVAA